MFRMFSQFFSMLSQLFSAGEEAASALHHLAETGNDEAEAFKLRRRLERQKLLTSEEVDKIED